MTPGRSISKQLISSILPKCGLHKKCKEYHRLKESPIKRPWKRKRKTKFNNIRKKNPNNKQTSNVLWPCNEKAGDEILITTGKLEGKEVEV